MGQKTPPPPPGRAQAGRRFDEFVARAKTFQSWQDGCHYLFEVSLGMDAEDHLLLAQAIRGSCLPTVHRMYRKLADDIAAIGETMKGPLDTGDLSPLDGAENETVVYPAEARTA